jgi:hypothetical protein
MIPANELRIGNWAYDNKLNGCIRFTSFHGLCNIENKPDDYDPIPLTPEVLEKCGFLDTGTRYIGTPDEPIVWSSGYEEIRKDFGRYEYVLYSDEWDSNLKSITVDYVHQLQNIYFAITGEELTVNL